MTMFVRHASDGGDDLRRLRDVPDVHAETDDPGILCYDGVSDV